MQNKNLIQKGHFKILIDVINRMRNKFRERFILHDSSYNPSIPTTHTCKVMVYRVLEHLRIHLPLQRLRLLFQPRFGVQQMQQPLCQVQDLTHHIQQQVQVQYSNVCDPENSIVFTVVHLSKCGHPVSYTHLRAHETPEHLVCRLLLEKKK